MNLFIESNEGEESQAVRQMLFDMYWNFCNLRNINTKWIVKSPIGPGAPERKEIVLGLEINSDILNGEQGIHRVVRSSPFDKKGRRHTTYHCVTTDYNVPIVFNLKNGLIRSYVFDPYLKVTDYKSKKETFEIKRVFAGHLDLIL